MTLNDLEWAIRGHVNYSKAIISQMMLQSLTTLVISDFKLE